MLTEEQIERIRWIVILSEEKRYLKGILEEIEKCTNVKTAEV